MEVLEAARRSGGPERRFIPGKIAVQSGIKNRPAGHPKEENADKNSPLPTEIPVRGTVPPPQSHRQEIVPEKIQPQTGQGPLDDEGGDLPDFFRGK